MQLGECCYQRLECFLIARANQRNLTIGDGAIIADACVITVVVAERVSIKASVAAQAAVALVALATSPYQRFPARAAPIRHCAAR